MAYRVVVADDDRLDLSLLTELVPWTELGLQLVGTAYSGARALRLVESESPDILVLDIRMPHLDGLEVCAAAKRAIPGLKVIFVSGHEDFGYARTALHLQADAYLLKPLEVDELIESLRRVSKEIGEARRRRHNDERLVGALSLLRRQSLTLKLYGVEAPTDAQLDTRDAQPGRATSWSVLVVTTRALQYATSEDEGRSLVSGVESACSQLGIDLWAPLSDRRVAVVLPNSTAKENAHRRKRLVSRLSAGVPGGQLLVGQGPPAGWDQLSASRRAAEEQLNNTVFFEGFVGEDCAEAGLSEHHRLVSAVLGGISRGERQAVLDGIDGIVALGSRLFSRDALHALAGDLLIHVDSLLRELDADLERVLAGRPVRALLQSTQTATQLRAQLVETIDRVMSYLDEHRGSADLVLQVQSYVEERIHERLSLGNVASYFEYSPNYLGRLFKDETGSRFTDYLTETRLKKAAELLRNTRLLVYEVADRVGYGDMAYFSRQFKAKFGVSPGRYRQSR